jgi:hypothetical protein
MRFKKAGTVVSLTYAEALLIARVLTVVGAKQLKADGAFGLVRKLPARLFEAAGVGSERESMLADEGAQTTPPTPPLTV